MTKKQAEIFNCIKLHMEENGYSPSIREICNAVGLKSTSTVHAHVKNLIKLGYLKNVSNKFRTIDLIHKDNSKNDVFEKNFSWQSIPLLGNVTAGEPITAIENVEETYYFSKNLLGHNKDSVFMLNIQGDSMIKAGILDGDIVFVNEQSVASNGDIVVALIDDENVTVKRYYQEKNYIRLQPENDKMPPIKVQNVKILGKVIASFRTY